VGAATNSVTNPTSLSSQVNMHFAGETKIMADMTDKLRIWAHWQLAHEQFHQMKILCFQEFDLVDWEMVYLKLQEVPKLFQLWTCKQVMGIASTIKWDKTVVRNCPSCMQAQDTCAHVLFCCHEGRVDTLKHTIDLMEVWLEEAEIKLDLLHCIAEYAHGWGECSMTDICKGLGPHFMQKARDQDAVGWRQFMESIVCKRMRAIQYNHQHWVRTRTSPTWWVQGLILELLEATHGQWIYRNIEIHDAVAGTQATLKKEVIQQEIKEQMELGEAGLLKDDHWMMEVNLGDIETTLGEQEEYWLVAIKAAQVAAMLVRQQTQTMQGHNN
jgi:hypothetical protein